LAAARSAAAAAPKQQALTDAKQHHAIKPGNDHGMGDAQGKDTLQNVANWI
jgi:hypothetical protein